MSEEKTDLPFKVPDLEIRIHEILRYTYAGTLSFFVAYLFAPDETKHLAETLTIPVIVALGVTGGAAVYAFYRGLLVWLFEPLHEIPNRIFYFLYRRAYGLWWDRDKNLPAAISKRSYLEWEFNVPYFWSAEAFRVLWKAPFFDKEASRVFYRQHSEATTLYITAVVFTSAVVIHSLAKDWAATHHDLKLTLLAISGFALFAAISWDAVISRQEGAYLRTLPREKIAKVLENLSAGERRN